MIGKGCGNMLKILLADDEREEREGIVFLIEKYQYPLEISEVSNGKKALEYIRNNEIDILFTDIKMPFMNGLELARAVHTYDENIKIIIFSAYGEFSYAKQALEVKAVSYLLKPIELDEFQKVMNKVITSVNQEKMKNEAFELYINDNKKNFLYRVFSTAKITAEDEKSIGTYLFPTDKENICLVNIEFLNDFYETYEEVFLNLVNLHLGGTTGCINLFQNEVYLIVRKPELMEKEKLERQLSKLLKDVSHATKDELSIIIGQPQNSIITLRKQLEDFNAARKEVFGFGNCMIWLNRENGNEYYVSDIEEVKKQLLVAIRLNNTELVNQFCRQLVKAICDNSSTSRIYIQNLFYSIFHTVYEANPMMKQEEIMKNINVLFQSRNVKKLVEDFPLIIQKMRENADEKSVDTSRIIQKIKNIVQKEYMHDLSLDHIAKLVNLTSAYVSYIFKKETGSTLVKYITDVKMQKAKILLEEGELKIVQVGRACGYENQPYFNRLFKNYYGITPKQFRER